MYTDKTMVKSTIDWKTDSGMPSNEKGDRIGRFGPSNRFTHVSVGWHG